MNKLRALAGAAIALAALSLMACSSEKEGQVLTRDSFQAKVGEWPLTVSTATVACGKKNPNSLGVEINGTVYALNGTATTFEGWDDLHAIWAPDPRTGAFVQEGDLPDNVRGYCARQ